MGYPPAEGSRVLVVDSAKSWDYLISEAETQACPVVVHFTADWCPPSKYMVIFFEELSLKYPDILFLLVDVDEVKGVASKMEVKAMPTFLFLKNGNQVDKIVGANAEELHKRLALFARMVRHYEFRVNSRANRSMIGLVVPAMLPRITKSLSLPSNCPT